MGHPRGRPRYWLCHHTAGEQRTHSTDNSHWIYILYVNVTTGLINHANTTTNWINHWLFAAMCSSLYRDAKSQCALWELSQDTGSCWTACLLSDNSRHWSLFNMVKGDITSCHHAHIKHTQVCRGCWNAVHVNCDVPNVKTTHNLAAETSVYILYLFCLTHTKTD